MCFLFIALREAIPVPENSRDVGVVIKTQNIEGTSLLSQKIQVSQDQGSGLETNGRKIE